VTRKNPKPKARSLTFSYALRSFVGHLEGTEKSAHTIKNYRSDLAAFQKFLEEGLGSAPVALGAVHLEDLEKYGDYLKAQGFKTNTRRRKILTIRKLLKFLTQRKKISIDAGGKIPAPHKVERIPLTVPSQELIAKIRALPVATDHHARNRALLWTLAETGCLVSEIPLIRFEDFSDEDFTLTLRAKGLRKVPVSKDLLLEIRALQMRSELGSRSAPMSGGGRPAIFLGFNKFGPLGSPITSRGIELLVKAYAGRLGFDHLMPRTFRHSAVRHWHEQGIARDEIQRRLGLKTDYAFRVYDPMLKSSSRTTSSSGTTPKES
jgi:site-specific recombinase XerD